MKRYLSFAAWAVCTACYWYGPAIARALRTTCYVLCLSGAALLWVLAGCATTKPKTDERANASVLAPPVKVATPDSNPLQTPATPDKTKPGLLSGIGKVFSTPEGTAARQARKLAKAQAPRVKAKVKDGAFSWGDGATATNVGEKSEGVAAGAGAVANNAEKKSQQQAATGDGNTQTQTPPAKPFPWWLLLVAAGLYGAWWLYRKTIPFA